MSTIQTALTQTRPPGIYRFVSRAKPDTLRRAVEQQGWRFFHLDGKTIKDKASFLQASAKELEFPSYFGHNWDAFNDSFNDLSWVNGPGYVVLYDAPADFAQNHPKDWAILQSIFQEAVQRWGENGTPLYILLRGPGIDAPTL